MDNVAEIILDTTMDAPEAGVSQSPAGTLFERLQKFKNIYVKHNQLEQIEKDLISLLQFANLGTEDGSALCYLLTGETGWGKTTLLRNFAREHGPRYLPEGNVCPVLYIELKGTARKRAVAAAILDKLQAVYQPRLSEPELTKLAAFHLRRQGVRVTIIDEAQNFVDQENQKFSYPVAEWLKGLLNEGACAFVFAGMPAARVIYTLDDQFVRRSFGSPELKDFSFQDAAEMQDFRDILDHLLENFPLPHKLSADETIVLYGLLASSHGRIGFLVDFLTKACIFASQDGPQCVEVTHLAAAAERLRSKSDPDWKNPFTLDAEGLLNELARLENAKLHNGPRLNLRRGKRQARMSDVFPG